MTKFGAWTNIVIAGIWAMILPPSAAASSGSATGSAAGQTTVFSFPTPPDIPSGFIVQALPLPPNQFDPGVSALNDAGQVLGNSYTSDYQTSFGVLWTKGQPQTLPNLGVSGRFYAWSLNNQGAVVGYADVAADYYHSFLWTPDEGIVDLQIGSSRDNNFAVSINDAGQIAGNIDYAVQGYLWKAGSWDYLPLPSDYLALNVSAMNSRGNVVGQAFTSFFEWRPVIYIDGELVELDGEGIPLAVNASNQVAGFGGAFSSAGAVFWDADGAIRSLLSPDGTRGYGAYSINDAGAMVGLAFVPGSRVAVYWPDAASKGIDLNTLLSAEQAASWRLREADAINRWGQIAGYGRYNNAEMAFLLTPAALSVDANRDGQVTSAKEDRTSAGKPFRFWINDDIDRGHTVDGNDFEEDDLLTSPDGKLDWEGNRIQSKRDLEDYFRLWISTNGLNSALKTGELFLGLKWTGVTGTPAVKLYRHYEADGGLGYLTDEATANQQIENSVVLGRFNLAIADQRDPNGVPALDANPTRTLIEGSSVGTQVFVLPTWLFANLSESAPKTCLLAEGCKPGQGQLQLVLLRKDGENYTSIGEGPGVWMDLKKVDDLYERWTVGDTNGGVPWANASRKKVQLSTSGDATGHSDGFAYSPSASEENKYILYVHGWNLPPWEKNRFAETAFKRLHWQGYKGRFGIFCWPTTYGFDSDFDAVRDGTNYDRGEWTAWRAATPLKSLLVDLKGAYGNQVYVLAHSMGNVVTGEALQLAALGDAGKIVNTYVASQAAIPAHVYDGGRDEDLAPVFSAITGIGRIFDGSTFPQTPNIYSDWLAGNGAAVGRRVNFHNENDYALWHDVWELNQYFKPDRVDQPDQPFDYSFVGDPQTGDPDAFKKKDIATMQTTALQLGMRADVMDHYEIMSFAAEARTKAAGAAVALPLFETVNLQSIWPADNQSVKLHDGLNYSAHKWHSAQFRSTNMRQKDYWQSLLGSIGFRIIIGP